MIQDEVECAASDMEWHDKSGHETRQDSNPRPMNQGNSIQLKTIRNFGGLNSFALTPRTVTRSKFLNYDD
jgi:hypothetical protein